MKERLKSYFLISFGIMLTGFAISVFLVPNRIVIGGVSGVATVLYYTIDLKPSLTVTLINAVLLLLSLKCFGWKFVGKTLFGIGMLSVLIEAFSYVPAVTDNLMLATIFGASLYGIGIGIVLSQGSTTGGTDILGRLIQHRFSHWKIGKILLGVDLFVISLSFATFRTTETVLYGVIALFISTSSIDYLMKVLNVSKLAFVITDRGMEISEFLADTFPRGGHISGCYWCLYAYVEEDADMCIKRK